MTIPLCLTTVFTLILGAVGLIGVLSLDFSKLFNLILDLKIVSAFKYSLRAVPLILSFGGVFLINQKNIIVSDTKIVQITDCNQEAKVVQNRSTICCLVKK